MKPSDFMPDFFKPVQSPQDLQMKIDIHLKMIQASMAKRKGG